MLTAANVPETVRSDTPAETAAVRAAAFGNAEVEIRPGAGAAAVTLDVGAYMVVTSESAARDLYACLRQVFDPLGEMQSAVRRSAALAGDPR